VRLNKKEKAELFLTIRYSFMKHEDLLALTSNSTFALAKDFIVEGLSVRLNPFENGIKGELKINVEPRIKQAAAAAKKPGPTDKKDANQ